jgi:hypothetical protein
MIPEKGAFPRKKIRIGELLINEGIITEEQLMSAM